MTTIIRTSLVLAPNMASYAIESRNEGFYKGRRVFPAVFQAKHTPNGSKYCFLTVAQ